MIQSTERGPEAIQSVRNKAVTAAEVVKPAPSEHEERDSLGRLVDFERVVFADHEIRLGDETITALKFVKVRTYRKWVALRELARRQGTGLVTCPEDWNPREHFKDALP